MIGRYQIPEEMQLSTEQIDAALSWKAIQNTDIDTADNYYLGKNEKIMSSDSNHKVPVPYARKLIKSVLGFMFKEGLITYSWPDAWEDYRKEIERIYRLNDEETENIRIAREQAMYGSGYEALYVDNPDGDPQFYRLHSRNVIPIYSTEIKPKMWAAINTYKIGHETYLEIYYSDRIERYRGVGEKRELLSVVGHSFGEVPIIEYRNNDEGMGDLESIMALIDANDEILTNGLDEDSKFADAMLLLKNIEMDDEKVGQLIRQRVLSMDDDGEASYLTKPAKDDSREVLRKTVENLIYSMSGIPNLDDKDALAAESGESLKYLYATFEIMVAGDKQSGFTDGLMRRLRLINNFLSWMGRSRVTTDGVEVKWARNLPAEGSVLIDNVMKVDGVISKKTQLEQLEKAGIIDNVTKELDRLEAEQVEDVTEDMERAYGEV